MNDAISTVSVVFWLAFRQSRAVGRATADHSSALNIGVVSRGFIRRICDLAELHILAGPFSRS